MPCVRASGISHSCLRELQSARQAECRDERHHLVLRAFIDASRMVLNAQYLSGIATLHGVACATPPMPTPYSIVMRLEYWAFTDENMPSTQMDEGHCWHLKRWCRSCRLFAQQKGYVWELLCRGRRGIWRGLMPISHYGNF